MADLADGVLGDFELARGEAIALLNQSAFATGYAALAFADALVLLDVFDHAGALDLEALGANRNSVHPAIGEARPYPGLQSTLARLGALLEGSEVMARDLQDPLTFRTIAQQNGAARDAFGVRRLPARDRAQRGAVEPARRRRRGQGDLGRQLRDAAARDRARHRPARARTRDLDGGRAGGEAPAAKPDGPHRGSRRHGPRWRRARSASTASRSRRSRSRRGCSPSPSRSISSRRPRPRGSRTG